MANLEKHYQELLGLTDGWEVTKVALELSDKRVSIDVEWTGPRVVSCPQCGQAVPLYDLREERAWRHLDVMRFETLLRSRVPRCKCPEHGVQTVLTPWAGKHGRFIPLWKALASEVMWACDDLDAAWQRKELSFGSGSPNASRSTGTACRDASCIPSATPPPRASTPRSRTSRPQHADSATSRTSDTPSSFTAANSTCSQPACRFHRNLRRTNI